jgi:hypothetical protein
MRKQCLYVDGVDEEEEGMEQRQWYSSSRLTRFRFVTCTKPAIAIQLAQNNKVFVGVWLVGAFSFFPALLLFTSSSSPSYCVCDSCCCCWFACVCVCVCVCGVLVRCFTHLRTQPVNRFTNGAGCVFAQGTCHQLFRLPTCSSMCFRFLLLLGRCLHHVPTDVLACVLVIVFDICRACQ